MTEIDVEMEDETSTFLIKGTQNLQDRHVDNKLSEDMEVDEAPKEFSNDQVKCHLTYEANNNQKAGMSDEQRLDYFHNVIMKE